MATSMATDTRNGKMALNSKETLSKVPNKDTEYLLILMEAHTKVNLWAILSKVTDILYGLTGNSTKGCGRAIRCMEKAILYGQMGEGTRESTLMALRKATESSTGQMGGATGATGKMANKTEKAW